MIKYYITVDWLINLLVDLTDLTVCLDTVRIFLGCAKKKMPHQLDKSKILPAVTTAIYMTGSNQKNASTYSKGLWEVARHTSIFTPTQHGLSVLWPFQVLWLRTKCCGNSVTGKQGVACMCNELPLAEFILKQNQKKKENTCYATVLWRTSVPMLRLMGASLPNRQMNSTPHTLHFSIFFIGHVGETAMTSKCL